MRALWWCAAAALLTLAAGGTIRRTPSLSPALALIKRLLIVTSARLVPEFVIHIAVLVNCFLLAGTHLYLPDAFVDAIFLAKIKMAKAKVNDKPKWTFLEHKGPLFTPEYLPLGKATFIYNNKVMELSAKAEEVACFYARLLHHEYTTYELFNKNFFSDWKEEMEESEKEEIQEFRLCNFTKMNDYLINQQKTKYRLSKEEKKQCKEDKKRIMEDFGYCVIKYSADGKKERERLRSFKVEKPGLFLANHSNMGKLKKRIQPDDVTINCSEDSVVPEPPFGHWKEVLHDKTVSWLACWTDPLQNNKKKYIQLHPSSQLKMETDCWKYERARKLGGCIHKIRDDYRKDWEENENPSVQQRAVAIYLIDKLAFRAGNENPNRPVDTVGCCSLCVGHVKLHEEMDELKYVAEFDFPGKDNMQYYNIVPIETRVFQIIKKFKNGKKAGDQLFDAIDPSYVNEYLKNWGVTIKVFRTYNASITMQEQLRELTIEGDTVDKVKAFKEANLRVGSLCNHRRTISTGHNDTLVVKAEDLTDDEEETDEKPARVTPSKQTEVLLKSSKLSYIDPRIVVAWCLKNGVELRDVYSEGEMEQFSWATKWEGVEHFVF